MQQNIKPPYIQAGKNSSYNNEGQKLLDRKMKGEQKKNRSQITARQYT